MKGVYPRENSILIYFQVEGQAYRETLTGMDGKPLPPTPKNVTYAGKVREQILRAVSAGTFDMREYFPKSRSLATKAEERKPMTVQEAVEAWLFSKEKSVARTTLMSYRSTSRYLTRLYAERPVADLVFKDIDDMMSQLHREKQIAANTHNSILSVVNEFCSYCVLTGALEKNPAESIKMLDRPDPDPDPLSPDEVARVLDDMREHYDPQIANYFEAAFRIGFRPSEGISLKWKNLDEKEGILRIDSARVWGIDKMTKTKKAREVELDRRTLEVLRSQRNFTGTSDHGHIFESPGTGAPWARLNELNVRYWAPSLKRCKIRSRDSRQTRHTCATMMLMFGCRDVWAARQLGHSVEMFRKVYSTWVPKIDAGRERSKMDVWNSASSSEKTERDFSPEFH